jgi:hypothetical protein
LATYVFGLSVNNGNVFAPDVLRIVNLRIEREERAQAPAVRWPRASAEAKD